jgi:hypothetical protein
MRAMDWTDLAQDKEKWRAVLIAVINLKSFTKCGDFLTSVGKIIF